MASTDTNHSVISGNDSTGIVVNQSSVTLIDRTIAINVNVGGGGGGILVEDLSSLKLVNSEVVRNRAEIDSLGGGGIFVAPLANSVTIINSKISGNSTCGFGGGIYLFGGSFTFTLDGSLITRNSAAIDGGGLFIGNTFTGPSTFTNTDSALKTAPVMTVAGS